ncbi:MAG TPA: hypothetical protein VJ696_02095 [Rhodanobacteraceae bacterium]|nr:hypothetical protein [Rhodanobacteraceae bacterium]
MNDRGWKTTERHIVFEYRDRTTVLVPHVPEHAKSGLLRAVRSRARAAENAATDFLDVALCASDPGAADPWPAHVG